MMVKGTQRIVLCLSKQGSRRGARLTRLEALLPKGSTEFDKVDALGITTASVPEGTDLERLTARLRDEEGVEWVEVDQEDLISE